MLKYLALVLLWCVAAHDSAAQSGPQESALLSQPLPPENSRRGLIKVRNRQQEDSLDRLILSAGQLLEQSRYEEAGEIIRQAQDYISKAGGTRVQRALVLDLQGKLLAALNKYVEAEAALKQSIELREQVYGTNSRFVIGPLQALTSIYLRQNRLQDALATAHRAFELARPLRTQDPALFASIEDTLSYVYFSFGHAEEAERGFLDARSILAAIGDRAAVGIADDHLATTYLYLKQFEKARQFGAEALAILRESGGAESMQALVAELNLSVINREAGEFADAEKGFRHVLAAYEARLGPDNPDTARVRNNLGWLELERGNPAGASAWFRQSLEMYAKARDSQAYALTSQDAPGGVAERETARTILGFLEAVVQMKGSAASPQLLDEAFRAAQWAHISLAARALDLTYQRLASGTDALAQLVRKEQDLAARWRYLERALLAAPALPSEQRDMNAESHMRNEQAMIARTVSDIGQKLVHDFPSFSAIANPEPAFLADAQQRLAPDEALILIVTFGDPAVENHNGSATFLFAVTQSAARFLKVEADPRELLGYVSALRCGLDAEAWADLPCAELAGQSYTDADRDAGNPLPFDYARAHRLFQALFGQVEDLIKGKQLLVVPSGPLTQLPFQVLVTAVPAGSDPSKAAWLIREHALTVLPAVSSLKAPRRVARPGAATKPMIGFGNPLLDGRQSDPRSGYIFKALAQRARDKQRCSDTAGQRDAALRGLSRGVKQVQTRGALADVEFIRMQAPLPETADELCNVARDVGADPGEIRLGARATEREVKRLSESGQLAQYRIVHFATHGALAGQIQGNSEAGLLLTPPAEPSEEDDGYLTASEIAGLKLDADWVILSACNTAAGGAQGAEALSGLARAFFYAQARALLVSHWEVELRGHRQADHRRYEPARRQQIHGPRRGHAPVHARAHR